MILRKLVRLRHTRTTGLGFPLGREFRVFLSKDRVLELGYYWETDDLSTLSPPAATEVTALATEASRRLAVPYLAVDVGQPEDGRWTVIEAADAQFAGLSQVSALKLWNKLKDVTLV